MCDYLLWFSGSTQLSWVSCSGLFHDVSVRCCLGPVLWGPAGLGIQGGPSQCWQSALAGTGSSAVSEIGFSGTAVGSLESVPRDPSGSCKFILGPCLRRHAVSRLLRSDGQERVTGPGSRRTCCTKHEPQEVCLRGGGHLWRLCEITHMRHLAQRMRSMRFAIKRK